MRIKIGTRKSELAMWQSRWVAEQLQKHGHEVEFVTMDSIGDKQLQTSIAEIGAKGAFTQELEDMLASGEVHIAVHSAKDLPSSLPEGFEILAVSPREESHDVLVSLKKKSIQEVKVIGTASVRRTAMLKHFYPDKKTVVVRGNLQTRMKKLEEGVCDALMLAYAGVKRMDFHKHVIHKFTVHNMTPVAGQGIIAVETHESLDKEIQKAVFTSINHAEAKYWLDLERAFFHRLEGGCGLPAFIHCHDECPVKAIGGVIDPDTGFMIQRTRDIFDIKSMVAFADEILAAGGKEILDKIKQEK